MACDAWTAELETTLDESGKRALAQVTVSTIDHLTETDAGATDCPLLCLRAEQDVVQLIESGERVATRLDGDLESRSEPSHPVVEDRTETYRDRVAAFLTEIGSQQQ